MNIFRVFTRFYHRGLAPFQQPHFKRKSEKIAIHDNLGQHSFKYLEEGSDKIRAALSGIESSQNVAFLTENNHLYSLAQFGIWKSGLACVPLCKSHPPESLKYYVNDSKATTLILSQDYVAKIGELKSQVKNLLIIEELLQENNADIKINCDTMKKTDDAMLIYTSGTTGSPKGVVLTMENVISQTECMIQPWGWTSEDKILHVLPLHHTHGIVNCLLCPLQVGASITMLPNFDAKAVMEHLISGKINVFMAVPTIYAKLLEFMRSEQNSKKWREILSTNLRLMVSGSAALPQPIFEEWKKRTGHTLLERYGMTEIGMALTNPLKGAERKPGFVGHPFPGVKARIVEPSSGKILVQGDETSTHITSSDNELVGDLQIKGPNVFKSYFGRPEATSKEFTPDQWFKTGDTATFAEQSFKILGRSSVDIIKSGGYKISALHVERLLLAHEDIADVAVLGIEDPVWGQKVAAVIVPTSENVPKITVENLRQWGQDKMPKYLIPSEIMIMSELPKNHMGKVNKKELVKQAFPQ